MTQTAQGLQSINYCTTNNRFSTDPICTGTPSNLYNGFNNIYTSNINDTNHVKFQNTIMDYCSTDNRFVTDTIFCNNPTYQQFLLNPKYGYGANVKLADNMKKYCSDPVNNQYTTQNGQTYCRTKDNDNTKNYTKDGKNLNMRVEYADIMRKSRLKYIQNSINDTIRQTNGNTTGEISPGVVDYINNDISIILDNKAIPQSAENPILTPELYTYCESVPDYKKNKLCNTVYSKFSNDPNVIASTTRINDFNYGISSQAFMGKSDSDVANTAYTAARDAPDSFAKYLPYALQYCGTNDNIVSEECTKYYNNVSNVINNGLASQYKSNSTYKTPIMQQDILNQISSTGMPMPKNTAPITAPTPVAAPVAAPVTAPPPIIFAAPTPKATAPAPPDMLGK
jgi:hypothetical protein